MSCGWCNIPGCAGRFGPPATACANCPPQLIRSADGYDPTALQALNQYVTGGLSSELADGLTAQGAQVRVRAMTPQSTALWNAGAANWEAGIDIANMRLCIPIYHNHPTAREIILAELDERVYFDAANEAEKKDVKHVAETLRNYSKTATGADSHKTPVKFAESKYPYTALLMHIAMVVKEGQSSVFSDVLDRVYDSEEGKFLVKWKGELPKITTEAQMLKIFNNFSAVARRVGGMGDSTLWDAFFDTVAQNYAAVGGAFAVLKFTQELLVRLDIDRRAASGQTLATIIGSAYYMTAFARANAAASASKIKQGEGSPDDESSTSGGPNDGKKTGKDKNKNKKPATPPGDACDQFVGIDKGAGVRFSKTGLQQYCNNWNASKTCVGGITGCHGTSPITKQFQGWCSYAHACPKCGLSDHREGSSKCKGNPGKGNWPPYKPPA